jgi:hypothetical protein
MTRGHSLPPPPQMGNGGSPPAHLSASFLSDPSWWLVAAIQRVAASPTRPRVVVRLLQTLQPPGQRWSPASLQRMASTSRPRRPIGCRIAAATIWGAHSSWGPCSRGTCLQGLEVGYRQTVGGRAPPSTARRRASRLRLPGGCPSTTAPRQASRSRLPGGCPSTTAPR